MPRFLSSSQLGAVIADGVYALKVTKATEKVSERGNPIIVMTLCLPDGRSLGCVLKNPNLARINLQRQPAVVLPVVCRTDNVAPVQLPNPKPTRTTPLFRDEPCRTIPD